MQRIDGAFVLIGALYGAAGMGFGIWMGVTHNLQFANAHAHINLVGFVSFMLFGIVYRLWPALKERRLAAAHFVLANVGAAMLLTGKAIIDATGEATLFLMLGAPVAVLGMLVFVANVGAAMLLTGKAIIDATGEATLFLMLGAPVAVLGMLVFVANLVVGLRERAPAGRLAPAG